jgi:predicted ribonuclease YlaK
MAWAEYTVDEQAFRTLKEHNAPIEVPNNLFKPNQGVLVKSEIGVISTVFERGLGLRLINDGNAQFKKSPNADLALYNDLLKNDNVNTVVVDGFMGTAKTSTVMAHVVEGILNGTIKKLYLSKPHEPLGKSYGHLPGELMDKLRHEFTSFYQYITRYGGQWTPERLMGIDPKHPFDEPKLECLPFEYLRGRDITEEGHWVVLDETQNTNSQEVFTFIGRVGDKAKLVLLGDTSPHQLDKKGVNPESNGLAFARRFIEDKTYGGLIELNTRNHILRGNRVRDLLDFVTQNNNNKEVNQNGKSY